MPIFEYKCASCGSVSEFLVGVAQEAENIRCEQCGSSKLKKVFSSVSFAAKAPAPGCGSCPAHGHSGSHARSPCEEMGCPRAV